MTRGIPWNWLRPGPGRDAARARDKARRMARAQGEAARQWAALRRLSRADRDREVRRLWGLGVPGVQLAGRFGISKARVSEICEGLPCRRRYGDPRDASWPFPRGKAEVLDAPAPRRVVPPSGESLPAPRPPRGSDNGRSKLDETRVARMKRLRLEGWTTGMLAREFGVGRNTVCYILTGKTWGHVEPAPPINGGTP